jgi:hypothetical protein
LQRKKELLFLQKKAPRLGKQKNSYERGAVAMVVPQPAVNRSFLMLFFKKEVLAFFWAHSGIFGFGTKAGLLRFARHDGEGARHGEGCGAR